jgi:tetratricopeptide (TPR) repeat protein
MLLKTKLARLTRLQRLELLALPLLAVAAAVLWTAPMRAERALAAASFNDLRALSKRQPDNPRVFYHLGVRLRDLGQLGPATAAFARAAVLDPDSEETWLAWGTTAAAFGRYQDAFEAFSKCAQANPKSTRAHMALALFCHERFALKQAYEEAAAATRCDPKNAAAWRLTGVTAMERRDFVVADDALARAATLEPANWRAQLALGQVRSARAHPREALDAFQRAAELAPAESAVTLALGQTELQLAKTPAEIEAARATLARASEQNPGSADARIALGQALADLQRWQDARTALEAAARLQPNSSGVHFELARVYRQLGETVSADRETKAHAAMKEYEEARLSLGSRARTTNDPAVRLRLARLCAAHGDHREAILAYRNLLMHTPGHREATTELARLEQSHPDVQPEAQANAAPAPASSPSSSVAMLLRDADSVLAHGKNPAAEQAYLQIVGKDPGNARAFQGLGLAMVREGKTEEAFRALDRAVQLDKHLAEAQFALARLYYDQGFIDEATRRMEALTKQTPGNPEYIHALAVCLLDDTSQNARTEQLLDQAIALDGSQAGYWRDLAKTAASLSKLEKAESSYRKALALDPERTESATNLAVFLLDHRPSPERQAEAEGLLRRVVAREPKNSDALLGLGRIAQAKGDVHEAVARLQESVAGNPNLAPAWYNLARAYDRAGDAARAQDCRNAFRDITTYRKELSDTEEQARTHLKDPKLRLRLARLYARGGQNARAINQYQVCLSLDHNSATTRKELESFTERLRSSGQLPSMNALNGMLLASIKAH